MSETSPFSLDSCALPLMEALIATQAVIVFDPQGYIAFVNNGFCEVMGYSPDALIGAHHRSFMPPGQADLPAYEAHWENLRAGRSSTATVLRVTAQGEERWLHGSYIPVRCSEGSVRWVLKTVMDVTAAEQERQTLAGEAEAVSQANAVIRFRTDGQILDANENFCKAMGYRLDQIKGRHHRLFVDPAEAASPAYREFWRQLTAGESMLGEFRHFRADGQEVSLPASYSPIRDRLGRVVAIVKVAQLSSARKQLALLAEVSQTLGSAGLALERSSEQISQTVEAQRGTTSTQAAAVAEVTSSLSELRQTSAQALEQAENLLSAAERTQDTSAQGNEIVGQSVDGMRDIRACVEVIQGRILALSDHTAQIGDIIATVNEIAEQSKLLALNASIEAARAGEFGKSFSVVANEMRDLAEQSKGATRQVRQLLSDIREATGAAVVATEDGIAKVDMGQGLANKAGEIMEALGTVISQSVDASRLIANASRQQGAGVSQVADAMVSIDRASRSTAQGMAEVQEGMAQLRQIARQMAERVRELQGGTAGAA